MILDKQVEIIPRGKSISYYRSLGYDCNYGTPLLVYQKDLSKNSHIPIEVQCDYCGNTYTTTMMTLCRYDSTKNACKNCQHFKAKDSNLKKYGVESPLSLCAVRKKIKDTIKKKYGVDNVFQDESIRKKQVKTVREKYNCDNVFQNENVKSKIRDSLIEHYGVDNPLKSKTIRDKVKNTCKEKYGVNSPLESQQVKDKIKETCLEKYGVEFPLQNENINNKQQETMLKRYGVKNGAQNKGILEKILINGQKTNLLRYGSKSVFGNKEISDKAIKNSFLAKYHNGSQKTSKNQNYLCELYNATLNAMFDTYFVDLYFPLERIYLEYNGTGHDISVKAGWVTQEDFNIKEIIRYKALKKYGLKFIKFIHNSKKLPDDQVLLDFKDIGFQLLLSTNNNWISFDLDTYEIETKYKNMVYKSNKNDVIKYLNTL